jgi:hypothetical protein
MKSSIFCNITPCNPLLVDWRFGGTSADLLATCFMLVSFLAYSSTVNMEATCSSETSVEFQRTTRRYIPEDRDLHVSIRWKTGNPRSPASGGWFQGYLTDTQRLSQQSGSRRIYKCPDVSVITLLLLHWCENHNALVITIHIMEWTKRNSLT